MANTKDRVVAAMEQPTLPIKTMRPNTLTGNFVKLADVDGEQIVIKEVKFLNHAQYGLYFVATIDRPQLDSEEYQLMGSAKVVMEALQAQEQGEGWPAAVTFIQAWNQDKTRQYWTIADPGSQDATPDLFADQ